MDSNLLDWVVELATEQLLRAVSRLQNRSAGQESAKMTTPRAPAAEISPRVASGS
jgi:hypothetical protein